MCSNETPELVRFHPYRNRRARVPPPDAIIIARPLLTESQRRVIDAVFDERGRQRASLRDAARELDVSAQYVSAIIRHVALLATALQTSAKSL